MTTPPEEPVNAAEEDPTVPPDETSDSHGVGSADGPSVAAMISDEDDLPDEDGPEVEVGIGPQP